MNNSEIGDVFQDIAGLLEMKGEKRFTVVAYQRAARALGHHPVDIGQAVRDGADLTEIPGVGKAIAAKTAELAATGRMAYFERLRAEFPDGILDVMRVPGIGPKTAKLISDELGVSTVADLEKAIEAGQLAELPRMGRKKADNVLREIRAARTKDDRVPIARAMPAAERLIAALKERCPSITALRAAGSLRRFEETIGDIDLVCAAGDPRQVLDTLVEQPNVATVLAHGDTKAAVVLSEGVQVDLRVVDTASFGALLAYSTGNRQHNILLREHALRLGLSLNEYGLTDVESGELERFADEETLYERLGLQYVAPELRQGMDEIRLAAATGLPRLVEVGDLRGDLHVHTDWSDGRDDVELMVAGARDRGYEYVAITDHSSGRGIANGLTEERLVAQAGELRRVEESVGRHQGTEGHGGRHPCRRDRRLRGRRAGRARLGRGVRALGARPVVGGHDRPRHPGNAQPPRDGHRAPFDPSHRRTRTHRRRLRGPLPRGRRHRHRAGGQRVAGAARSEGHARAARRGPRRVPRGRQRRPHG